MVKEFFSRTLSLIVSIQLTVGNFVFPVVSSSSKFFFNRLVSFMSSGPLHCHVLAREDAIAEWRRIMGPTKVFKTRCGH